MGDHEFPGISEAGPIQSQEPLSDAGKRLVSLMMLGNMHRERLDQEQHMAEIMLDAVAVILKANGGSIEVKTRDCKQAALRGHRFLVSVNQSRVRIELHEGEAR